MLVRPGSGGSSYRGRQGSKEIYVGSCNELSLKQAKEKWRQIRVQAKQLINHPELCYTLKELTDEYIKRAKIAENTRHEYHKIIENDILPVLGPNTKLFDLQWDHQGRAKILQMQQKVVDRGSLNQANKLIMIARCMFRMAIDMQWMKGENPAISSNATVIEQDKIRYMPAITIDEVPDFLSKLEENATQPQVKTAVKLLLLTVLRRSALVSMQWQHIDFKEKLLTIPGDTKGVKRRRQQKLIPHEVPLTDGMIKLLDEIKDNTFHQANLDYPYVFYPNNKLTKSPHMSPASLTQLFPKLGYKDIFVPHGVRALASTTVREKLGMDWEVIDLVLGHIRTTDVRSRYDRATLLPQRRKFHEAWEKELISHGLTFD